GLQPHSHRDRRLLAAGLQRVRRPRDRRELHRVPGPGGRLVRNPGDHHRSGPHRQRCRLPQPRLGPTLRRPRHPPQPHPPLPAAPAPSGRAPTGRGGPSTPPRRPGGLFHGPGPPPPAAPAPLTAGSTATTITATTPPSAAHPPAESPTSPATTPRPSA